MRHVFQGVVAYAILVLMYTGCFKINAQTETLREQPLIARLFGAGSSYGGFTQGHHGETIFHPCIPSLDTMFPTDIIT